MFVRFPLAPAAAVTAAVLKLSGCVLNTDGRMRSPEQQEAGTWTTWGGGRLDSHCAPSGDDATWWGGLSSQASRAHNRSRSQSPAHRFELPALEEVLQELVKNMQLVLNEQYGRLRVGQSSKGTRLGCPASILDPRPKPNLKKGIQHSVATGAPGRTSGVRGEVISEVSVVEVLSQGIAFRAGTYKGI